ncbi:hypothetical protein MTO96_007183 [Rhipicephalus appendiculatus]
MQRGTLLAILVLISTDITIHTAGWDVRKFVSTFEQIWTYKTTDRAHTKCEVDQLISVRPLGVTLKRCVFFKGSRCRFPLLGVFDVLHKERMTLLQKDTFQTVENLLFMAFDRSCAVFRVESLTHWHQSHYDLRLKNSSVHKRPLPVCQRYFKHVVGREPIFFVYDNQCQRLFRQ